MGIVKPEDIYSWYPLVEEAKRKCGYKFENGLDHYLVLTLDAFVTKTDIASNALALAYLENIQHETRATLQNIRDVGDQCLIISGLFPERALKHNVSLDYYIGLGQNSYMKLANARRHLKLNNELFYELGIHFVGLMDILNMIANQNKQ